MTESPGTSAAAGGFHVSISSLTLGTLYESVLEFSSQDRPETFWPSVFRNARWIIPSRRAAILLCDKDENLELVGTFERGKFRSADQVRFSMRENAPLKQTIARKTTQWVKHPWKEIEENTGDFTHWLLHDHPDLLFVVPMRVKGKTIGALLFVMASLADTDQAMLNTLATIYALHVGMTYTLLEVTEERRQMQDRLIVQEKMASLGSLVAGVAHEINNPLGAVRSATDVVTRCVRKIEELLQAGGAPADASTEKQYGKVFQALRDNAGVIALASDRITTIVRSLKNFARIDEAEYQRANIHEGIDAAVTLLESELGSRVTLVKEYDDQIPNLYCYPAQLNQVFMSLLKNAAEALDGSGTIRIKTERRANTARIQISDTGRGLPPEKLKSIFNFDFSHAGSRVKMGSGLVTAYNIVQRHKGEIRAESTFGSGSSFTITLPIET